MRVSTKALCAPGLVFGTKIQPQYSKENVVLIFLLVSLITDTLRSQLHNSNGLVKFLSISSRAKIKYKKVSSGTLVLIKVSVYRILFPDTYIHIFVVPVHVYVEGQRFHAATY